MVKVAMRKLRPASDDTTKTTETHSQKANGRVIRQAPATIKDVRADRFHELQTLIKRRKDELKKELALLEHEHSELKAELESEARTKGIKTIEGEQALVLFEASTKTIIDPQNLANHLKKTGQLGMFWDLVTVRITECKDSLGAKVLEADGVISYEVDDFGRMKVLSK